LNRPVVLPFVAALLLGAAGVAAQEEPDLDVVNRGKPPVRRVTAARFGALHANIAASSLLNKGKPVAAEIAARLANVGAPKDREFPVIWAIGGATVSDFPNLESVGCDQLGIAGCSVDRVGFGPALGVLVRPSPSIPIGLGVRGGLTSVSVTQMFRTPTLPVTSVTDLDVWSATAFVDGWLSLSARTRAVGTLGWVWSWNRATITSTFADSRRVVEQRSENGGRYTIGAAIERDIFRRAWLRLEYRFIDGDAGDADRQHQVGLLLGLGLPGGGATRPPPRSRAPRRGANARGWPDAWPGRAGVAPPRPNATIDVPGLVGLDIQTARGTLAANGLAPGDVTEQTSPEPGGTVLAQTPDVGVRLPFGGTVDLVVAIDSTAMGDYTGVGDSTATGDSAAVVPPVAVSDSMAAAGDSTHVIEPGAVDDPVATDDAVAVSDSTADVGLPAVRVPPLLSRDIDGARRTLDSLGLPIRSITARPDSGPPGGVIDVDPPIGTAVVPGDSIDLVTSRWVTVPDLAGLERDPAADVAADSLLGFVDGGRRWSLQPGGTVLAQTPPPGSEVPPATAIRVTLARPALPWLFGGGALGLILGVFLFFGKRVIRKKMEPRKLTTVGFHDLNPHLETDRDPRAAPDIRTRAVKDLGEQSIDEPDPLVGGERSLSDTARQTPDRE